MQKPKKEADLLSRPLTEKAKNGKKWKQNGKKWKNIGIAVQGEIKHLQDAGKIAL
jgi:hypothetical protein